MTTALVKSSNDIVHSGTGEVVGEVEPFSMPDYLTSISTPAAFQHQQRLAAAYDSACASLIGPNDVQIEGARTFKKKSAWAKLGRHFNISTVVVSTQKEMLGEIFCATVTVKALSPWGQSAEAVGACATDEESGRRSITIADAIATAETRAHNRAISRLIAMGEVSAEEMSKGAKAATTQASPAPREGAAGEQTPGPTRSGKPLPHDKLMPFGDDKGVPLGEIDNARLQKTVTWCKGKDAKKFADLIVACETVIASRTSAHVTEDPDSFPAALADDDDSLPF